MEVDGVIASTRTGIDADTASEKTGHGGKETLGQNNVGGAKQEEFE